MTKAVFLDKDGTLVHNAPYNVDPALLRLTPRAEDGLRLLHGGGYALIVVSNQSGVAHGYFTEDALKPVASALRRLLEEVGVPLAGFHYCPHHPDGTVPRYAVTCSCRKPAPGLVLDAALAHGVTPRDSWLIGDTLDDVEAGHRAGCRTVLLDNGGETEWDLSLPERRPRFMASDLYEAARGIMAVERGGSPRGIVRRRVGAV